MVLLSLPVFGSLPSSPPSKSQEKTEQDEQSPVEVSDQAEIPDPFQSRPSVEDPEGKGETEEQPDIPSEIEKSKAESSKKTNFTIISRLNVELFRERLSLMGSIKLEEILTAALCILCILFWFLYQGLSISFSLSLLVPYS